MKVGNLGRIGKRVLGVVGAVLIVILVTASITANGVRMRQEGRCEGACSSKGYSRMIKADYSATCWCGNGTKTSTVFVLPG